MVPLLLHDEVGIGARAQLTIYRIVCRFLTTPEYIGQGASASADPPIGNLYKLKQMPDDFCCRPRNLYYNCIIGVNGDTTAMIDINAPYQNYALDTKTSPREDRLPLASALLAVFGLSLVGWAVLLAPLATIFLK